jgi:predicted ATPase with chaperone activity
MTPLKILLKKMFIVILVCSTYPIITVVLNSKSRQMPLRLLMEIKELINKLVKVILDRMMMICNNKKKRKKKAIMKHRKNPQSFKLKLTTALSTMLKYQQILPPSTLHNNLCLSSLN